MTGVYSFYLLQGDLAAARQVAGDLRSWVEAGHADYRPENALAFGVLSFFEGDYTGAAERLGQAARQFRTLPADAPGASRTGCCHSTRWSSPTPTSPPCSGSPAVHGRRTRPATGRWPGRPPCRSPRGPSAWPTPRATWPGCTPSGPPRDRRPHRRRGAGDRAASRVRLLGEHRRDPSGPGRVQDRRADRRPQTVAAHAAMWEFLGARVFLPYVLTAAAETSAALGNDAEAVAGFAAAGALVEETGVWFYEAERLRLLARRRRRAPSRERCCARPGSWPTGRGRCCSSCGPPSTSPVRPGSRLGGAAGRGHGPVPARRRLPRAQRGTGAAGTGSDPDMTGPPRVLVLGGGMAGLVAAWRLSEPGWRERFSSITVLERGSASAGRGIEPGRARPCRGARPPRLARPLRQRLPGHARVLRGAGPGPDRPVLPDPRLARRLPPDRRPRALRPGPRRLGAMGGEVLDQPAPARRAGRGRPRPLGRRAADPERAAAPRLLRLARTRPAADAGPARSRHPRRRRRRRPSRSGRSPRRCWRSASSCCCWRGREDAGSPVPAARRRSTARSLPARPARPGGRHRRGRPEAPRPGRPRPGRARRDGR